MKRVRITVAPFNYSRGRTLTAVIREAGTYPVGEGEGEVLPEIAQAAVDKGYGEWFDPKPAKPAKSGTTTRRRSSRKRNTATGKGDDAANAGQSDRMGRAGVVADGNSPNQRADDAAE